MSTLKVVLEARLDCFAQREVAGGLLDRFQRLLISDKLLLLFFGRTSSGR